MSDINVISRTQHIIVDPATSSVSVINAGPIGPGGPQGVGTTAAGTTIIDAGNHFPTDNVEDTLQVIGGSLEARDATLLDHETRITTNEAKIVDNDQRIAENLNHANSNQILISSLATDISALDVRLAAEELETADVQNKNTQQDTEIANIDTRLLSAEASVEGLLLVSGDDQSASEVSVDDAGNHYASTNVEDVLQEIYGLVSALDTLVHDHINDQAILNSSIAQDLTNIHARLDALENP